MKILLINPPRENEIIGNNPSIVEEERGHNPPLGLLYVAAAIQRDRNDEVAVVDAQVEELDYPSLERRIYREQPDVVGLTAMTMTLVDVIKTIELVKKATPRTLVVLGGPHVHLYPEETLDLPGVDYLVLGEGDFAFVELLDGIQGKRNLSEVKGIAYRENGETVNTGPRPPIEDLDTVPFPARRLVPFEKYSSLLARDKCVTTMFTSRGCPFKCAFCDRPHLGHKFRARSAGNVVDEIEECVAMGIEEFLIYDDTFTVDRKRAMAICDEIRRRNLRIRWDIRTRVDTVDAEVLAALSRAGCQAVHYGVEAGTEKILKVLNKNISIEKVEETFSLTRKHGMSVLAYFMIGSPDETLEDIRATFEVMKRLDPDYVHLTILTPFPGTAIYRDGLERGIIERDYWREFARNPRPDFVPPHWSQYFKREELASLLAEGYRGFYTRPKYILKRLGKIRSWGEIKRQGRAGLKVMGMR